MKKILFYMFFLVVLFYGVYLLNNKIFTKNTQKVKGPKNLILISIDTLRADSMGVYGYKKNTTPNIDVFAKKSTVFTNAYTQVPATYPSFASLMTGISPFESGIYSNARSTPRIAKERGNLPLDKKTLTLAQILKENRYSTAAFLQNPVLDSTLTKLNKDFDYYKINDAINYKNPKKGMVDSALTWLTQKTSDRKPFFLWVHFLDPHSTYTPPPEYACKFNSKFCEKIASEGLNKLSEKWNSLNGCQQTNIDQATIDLYKTLYDGEIAATDSLIGVILNQIYAAGLDKNSIIVIYGDHGEGFEHNYFGHSQMLYESAVRIPFILYEPQTSKKNKKDTSIITSSDIFLMLLKSLDIDTSSVSFTGFKGKFSDQIRERKNDKSLFYINSVGTKFAIKKAGYKYILTLETDRCPRQDKDNELYNIINDPNESINLINQNNKLAMALHTELINYIKKHSLLNNKNQVIEDEKDIEPMRPDVKMDIIDKLKSLGY